MLKNKALLTLALAMSCSAMTASVHAQSATGSQLETDFSNGCNALRYTYGQTNAGVRSACDVRNTLEAPVPRGGNEAVTTPSDPAPAPEPTEEDYNAWVEFFRNNCAGGTNFTEFSQIVDKGSTWYCRDRDAALAFPPPAPTYFMSGLDFYHSDGITSLSGFEYLETIPSMILDHTNITDISPLSNLTSIGTLSVRWTGVRNFVGLNNITDMTSLLATSANLESLAGLENLSTVDNKLLLDNNQLVHVDELSNLTRVGGELKLGNNFNLSNIDGLANLQSVNVLDITGAKITHIDGLSGLTEANDVRLGSNRSLQNLDGLSGLKSMKLNIWYNTGLTDVTGLRNMESGSVGATSNMRSGIQNKMSSRSSFCTNVAAGNISLGAGLYYGDYCRGEGVHGEDPVIAWIDFSNTYCLTSNHVDSLAEVETARLGCGYQDIKSVTALPPPAPTALDLLSVYRGSLVDISGLSLVSTANEINLRFHDIVDATPLSGLTSIGNLVLSNNDIVALPDLRNLTSIMKLDFSYNEIADISGFPQVTTVGDVNLSINDIHDLSSMSSLTQVGTLRLNDNLISNTYGLHNLNTVTFLLLSNNPLYDLGGIANISAGTVNLGTLSRHFKPLDNTTAFCQAVRAGNVTLQSSRSVDDVCVDDGVTGVGTAERGVWVWNGRDFIGQAGITNTPLAAPQGACGLGDEHWQANDDAPIRGAEFGDACTQNNPYFEAPGNHYGGGYASESGGSGGSGDVASARCYYTDYYACDAEGDLVGQWVVTQTYTREEVRDGRMNNDPNFPESETGMRALYTAGMAVNDISGKGCKTLGQQAYRNTWEQGGLRTSSGYFVGLAIYTCQAQ